MIRLRSYTANPLRQCHISSGTRLNQTHIFFFNNSYGSAVRHILMGLGAIIALSATPLAAAPPSDTALLAFIRHYEAGGAYDRIHSGIRQPPPKPLTRMSVGEVMAWQASLRGVISTAAGGYQIIKDTLARLVRRHRIDRAALFDAAMQDRLARLLIADCQDAHNRGGNRAFANCLARIWAALPLVSGRGRGRSAYHGIAGNRAGTTPARVMAVIEGGVFTAPTRKTRLAQHQSRTTGSPYQTRYERIKVEHKRAAATGKLGRSVVYSRDPYAVE